MDYELGIKGLILKLYHLNIIDYLP